MIFTSNMSPNKWGEFFSKDSSLLCALDRIFDDATVFMMKGNSYRGKSASFEKSKVAYDKNSCMGYNDNILSFQYS